MKIVLDVMGGDLAPQAPIHGAINALEKTNNETKIILIGDQKVIAQHLKGFSSPRLSINHASESINTSDRASKVVKSKPDSSMVRGLNLVKEKKADAFISCLLYTSPSPRDRG